MAISKAANLNCIQRFSYGIVKYTELFFYKLGLKVGANPKLTIVCCWVVVILSAFGFLRFRQEKNPMKLWVPPYTSFVKDSEWLMSTFQQGYRIEAMLITAPNVLTPEVLKELISIDKQVHRSRVNNITWNDVCFKIPKINSGFLKYAQSLSNDSDLDISMRINPVLYCSLVESMPLECYEQSILEFWNFNETKISNLTLDEILDSINKYDSTVFGHLKNYSALLSGVRRNESGHIIAATALHNVWMTKVNFSDVDMDIVGNSAGTATWASEQLVEWEAMFVDIMKNATKYSKSFEIYYSSARSFADVSNATMFQDIGKLCIGVFIMVIYVQFVISKFNWLEARIVLGFMGLLAVGMAFVVGCGLSSLIGLPYGPVHTSLPFLLMGLGVDDMFVLMACWDDLTREQKKLPLDEKIGLILKHGGVSITVTSVTDVLAFLMGASTILPSLESYCLYAALCVFMTYVFAVTFFTACFTLDQKRVEARRNGIIPCIRHEAGYESNECSQKQLANKAFRWVYKRIVFTWPAKLIIVLVTLICLGFSIESCLKLEQRFDPLWFAPKKSDYYKYMEQRKSNFPSLGFEGGLYVGSVNYSSELMNIRNMVWELENNTNIITDVISWVDPFREFVQHNFKTDIYEEPLNSDRFNIFLSKFLFSPNYAKYQANFQFNKPLECGVPAPKIILSIVNFQFVSFSGPEQYLPAMHKVYDIVGRANLTTGDKFATAWSKSFATWVTDEVIDIEVLRNLQLALLCVMLCTVLLLANLQTCLWVFICVLFTMVNVCGFMQRWGLTIDLVSCIGLELAIGLCVDYATHIGHTFLTISHGTRTERALRTVETIGSAVLYGGLSTLIGVFMLSQSDAYTFQSFFKIFLLVIVFGLFHGVVLLPVIMTWVGPKPYEVAESPKENDIAIINLKEKAISECDTS